VKGKLPALIAVTKDINQPRYPSLLGIRKAAKAEVTVWTAEELGVTAGNGTRITARMVPPARAAGEILQGEAAELVEALVTRLESGKFI
jgi:electron transfer flavoprotein beta subunit